MKVLYFAWIRERTGLAEEEIELPETVETVADLVGWLKGRGDTYEHAFGDAAIVRAAVDRTHAAPGASVRGAREVAFFPPMTGG